MPSPNAIEIVDLDQFTLAYHNGLGLTDREARRAIRLLLETHNVFVNPSELDPGMLAGEETENDAVLEGTAWAQCNDNGSLIVAGKPVVLDPETGNAFTGIGTDWYRDEYVIFGIALKDGTGGSELLPIQLLKRQPLFDGMRLRVMTTETIEAGDLDGGECEIYTCSPGGLPVASGEFIIGYHIWITGGGQSIPPDTQCWMRWHEDTQRFESDGVDC